MIVETAALTQKELATIVALVYEKSGITLHDGKRELITARLQKRLRQLGLNSYSEYLQRLAHDQSGDELTALLDAISTNHTSFFREPQHFEFLTTRGLAELTARAAGRPLAAWSAACSSGEEPFTIVMTALEAGYPDIRLLASDLSTKALLSARRGVYPIERVEGIPRPVLRKYFERGLGDQDGLARVAPAVRRLVEFRALNLIEITHLGQNFDFIFCRNVMIYFDRAVQQRVVAMLERHLTPGGYLFIAHSESLNAIDHSLEWVAPAVYRRRAR